MNILTAKRSGPASNAQPIPPMFRDALFPLVGGYWKIKSSLHYVRKGFQDTTLTDCDLGKEEEFRPLKGELKHDLQLSSI